MPPARIPPHSPEAEAALLGAILVDPVLIHQAVEQISPADFYNPAHALIFRTLSELADRGEGGGPVVLVDTLRSSGELKKAGGAGEISKLPDADPGTSQFPHYLKIVRDKSLLRRLLHSSQETIEEVFSATPQDSTEEVLEKAEQRVFGLTSQTVKNDFRKIGPALAETFEDIKTMQGRGRFVTGVPSGFYDLDKLTTGFHPGEMIVVAARPSMGKTAFVLDIIRHVAFRGQVPVAFFSLEMSWAQISMRILSAEASVPLHDLRRAMLYPESTGRMARICERWQDRLVVIDDSSMLSPLEIRAKARRLRAEGSLGLLIVDYLQLIHVPRHHENRQQEISEISRSLKALAKELEIPVIVVSQLNRACELRKPPRPMLADLRESGAIEQDADLVVFIYRDEMYHPDSTKKGIAELIVGKQRNGPVGSVDVAFVKEFARFGSLNKGDVF